MKNKHPDDSSINESESFKCKVCGNTFDCETDFKKHLLVHFTCKDCGTPFEDTKYLNRHI